MRLILLWYDVTIKNYTANSAGKPEGQELTTGLYIREHGIDINIR